MTGREVARRFKVSEFAASTPRVGLLAELTALYRRRKVMTRDGRCCPLDQCCDSATVCWRTANASDHRGRRDSDPREPDGSIFWPWIGEHYVPGGLCVVAINLNLDTDEPEQDWWETTVEYAISARTGEYLGAGLYSHPLWPPSKTGYRMAASAAAVLTAWNGMRPPSAVEPDPRALVGFLEHIARVQTIKCSPRDRLAGQPTFAMWRQCPRAI